jgi:hypothetical protein
MTPRITPEQRHAIDEQNGHPVYVVDADRNEAFVLLTSSDYNRVRPVLGYGADDSQWSDEKDTRRLELIDKKIAGSITDGELVELAELQRQGEVHFDQIAPPPMSGVRELHQQLLNRRDSQQ